MLLLSRRGCCENPPSTADFCTLVQDLSSNTSRVYWHICRAFLYSIYHISVCTVCCDVSKRGFVSRSLHYWWTLSGRPTYHHHFHLINFSHCLWPMINVWESWNTHFPPLPCHPLHSPHCPLHPSHHHLCHHYHHISNRHLARPHAGDSSCDRRCEEQDWVKRAFELT